MEKPIFNPDSCRYHLFQVLDGRIVEVRDFTREQVMEECPPSDISFYKQEEMAWFLQCKIVDKKWEFLEKGESDIAPPKPGNRVLLDGQTTLLIYLSVES
jgi:hypothetical protein